MEDVRPEHVLVTTGAAEALLILFHTAAEPGANVVMPNPGFPMNEAVAESLGLEIRRYTLRPEDGFHIDLDEINRSPDQVRARELPAQPHRSSRA
jgi:aspartate/methionine/tyrosine aminotransferase